MWYSADYLVMALLVSKMWLHYADIFVKHNGVEIVVISRLSDTGTCYAATLISVSSGLRVMVSRFGYGTQCVLPEELDEMSQKTGGFVSTYTIPLVTYGLRLLVAQKCIAGFDFKYNAKVVV